MARGAARAIHCNGEAVTLGPCGEGQFVKRQGNTLVGAEVVAGGGAAWGDITGTLSTQADLQGALDGKEDAGAADTAIAAHEAAGDPHTAYLTADEADALYEAAGAVATHAGAADPHPGYLTSAEGNAAYEAAGAVATHAAAADPHTGYQKESEKGAANGYASLGADGKVPSAQLPASSGSEPWTYLRLANDFTTTSATAVDVTGLGFAPAANERYEFVGRLMVRTATATVGPRPGIAWPTGLSDGVAFIQQTSSATANVFANGNISAAVLAPVGGLPTTTGSWPALIEGQAMVGASPSGNIRVQLASETAGTTVTMKAGSFLKYRTVP